MTEAEIDTALMENHRVDGKSEREHMIKHEALKDLEPIADHILFQFADEVHTSGNQLFKNKTEWGFELGATHEDTTQTPRWVEIIGLGPDVPDIFHVGQTVLVKALSWTRRVEYGGIQFARTDPEQILAVDDDT
jgi:hypothetical protein